MESSIARLVSGLELDYKRMTGAMELACKQAKRLFDQPQAGIYFWASVSQK